MRTPFRVGWIQPLPAYSNKKYLIIFISFLPTLRNKPVWNYSLTFFAKRAKLVVMSKRSKQKTTKEGEQMVMTGFRILPSDLVRAKQKVGLVALSKYLRALFLMWLNNEIVISEKDVEKYN